MKNSVILKVSLALAIVQLLILSVAIIYVHRNYLEGMNRFSQDMRMNIMREAKESRDYNLAKEERFINRLITSIEGSLSQSLFALDKDGTVATLKKFMEVNENIRAINIYDLSDGTLFISALRNGKGILFSPVPNSPKGFLSTRRNLTYNGELLGYMEVYYDIGSVVARLEKKKTEDINNLTAGLLKLEEDRHRGMLVGIGILLFGVLLTTALSVFLIFKLVHKPLQELKRGLDSFFRYLANPEDKVNEILISSKDEFGQMASSINKSVKVSTRLHDDIRKREAQTRKLNEELKDKNREIKKMNEELEDRIRERTEELERANQRLQELASRDSLTGLYNRRFFFEAVDNNVIPGAIREGKPVSAFIIDIDKFKSINDTYGHDVGDLVIKRLADIISSSVRKGDIAARLGGEEFAVVLPETNIHSAIDVATRIKREAEGSIVGNGVRFTVSIGVSDYDKMEEGISETLRRADVALYRAKRNGRNRIEINSSESTLNDFLKQ